MSTYPPAQPSRRYTRRRRPFSLVGALLGLVIGLVGSFYYTQVISPVREERVEPSQLNAADRDDYRVALALAFSADGDLNAAMGRLLALGEQGDPIQAMADTACRLATSGYVSSSSGLNAVRALINFYQLQGRGGCADALIGSIVLQPTSDAAIELPTSTPTLPPPASKTPTPENAPATPTPLVVVPTLVPQNGFELLGVTTFCDADLSALIQVFVYEINGSTGVPGQEIRARWQNGESRFFTGLKREQGAGYADFAMREGDNYLVDMPGQTDPLSQALEAVPCTTENGERALISYRVVFRELP